MIVLDLKAASEIAGKSVHQLIDDAVVYHPETVVQHKWREYAAGKMDDHVSASRRRAVGSLGISIPQQNMIRMCARQIAGRVRFDRFAVDHDETQKFLDAYAVKNNLVKKIPALVWRLLTDGNSAWSQVWRDSGDGMAYIRQEYWWDQDDLGMFVAVNEAGDPVWAVAQYRDVRNILMRVIYYPDRFEIYEQGGGTNPQEGEWHLIEEADWLTRDGEPIGMPVTHFSNSDLDYGQYGFSTVAEVIASQDALNLSLFNRMAVSALTGQKVYWATGVKKNPGEDGVGPGTFLWSDGENVKFGAIDPGDIGGLMTETDDLRDVVSGAFPVPSYRLGGSAWPSGLALQRSDGPMLTVVKMIMDSITHGLIHHAHRATIMANTFGTRYNLDTEALISVEWHAADELDPATESEILSARAETLAMAESLSEPAMRKLGMFSEDEIRDIIAWREAQSEKVLGDAGDDDME